MILAFHHGAIGDFVLTLALLQSIKQAHRESALDVIALAGSARLAAGHSAVDRCHSPEAVGLHTLFAEFGPLADHLAVLLREAGVAISFLGPPGDNVHDRLARSAATRVFSVNPLPTRNTLDRRRHITQQWAQTLREQGLAVPDPTPPTIRLDTSPAGPRPCETHPIVIHPGSGGRFKCWPVDRFVALAERIETGQIMWLLGPAEVEDRDGRFEPIVEYARQNSQPVTVETELHRAAEAVCQARLYIGNDGGMTHLAAALGVPTVALFGPTDPAIWRPLGPHVHVAATPKPGDAIAELTLPQVCDVVSAASTASNSRR